MLSEPVWTRVALLRGHAPAIDRPRFSPPLPVAGERRGPRRAASLDWMVYAAPFAVAVVWAAAMGVSLLLWSVTGYREPLEWSRSGSALVTAGALAVVAAVLASALKGVVTGPDRFVDHSARRSSSQITLPPEWLREEGGIGCWRE